MKKLLLLIFLFTVGSSVLFAQTILITGTVTSAVEVGEPIPGATVQVKGTNTGATTDSNGKYSLRVPQNATTLIFSFVGMKKQELEIASRTVVDVVLESDLQSLQEVIITTGYDIKRATRSASSLNQVVNGEKLNETRQTNVNYALAGKTAGIQVRGQSGMALDRTGSVRLRGDGGFSFGGSVLYVVDGTILPNSSDLNMDDIEDISVLSGPGASAILGSQGANGAIIITTKKAKISDNGLIGIEFNTGAMTSAVYILPEYQNDYAGGMAYDMAEYTWKEGDPIEWQPLSGKYYPDYAGDRNWGPRMEGQEYIPWYAWYPGTKYTGKTARLVPQPDNVREFYERGWSFNNNISFSKAGEGYNIRAVVGNNSVKGNIPGSSSNKTTLALKTSYDLTRKLTFGASINFFTTLTNGEFFDGWSNQTTGSFNQWFHRDLDMNIMRELRGLRTPDGIYASWNHAAPTIYDPENPKEFYAGLYWYNFYTWFDLLKLPSRTDRLFGDLSLNYKIIEGLSIKVTYRRQQNNGWHEQEYSSDLNESSIYGAYFSDKARGYYYSGTSYSNRENIESLFTYTKKIGDFRINANTGSDFFSSVLKSNSANTVNGLVIKNLFSIYNSVYQPNVINIRTTDKYRALFLRGDIGYRDFLFGEFTLRNDWYSALPPSDNSVFSKSFGGALIFSDLLNFPFLDFGKIRASWGEIPTSIEPYSYPGLQYSVEQYKRYGNIKMITPDQFVDQDIHGAVKTQKEVGMELRFLNNRFGFSATWWDGTEKNIPLAMTLPGYTGFKTKLTNSGEIVKQGMDFVLYLRAVTNSNLVYEISTSFSFLIKNDIKSIANGIDQIVLESPIYGGAPIMVHAVGKPWGELFGSGMVMFEGKPQLNPDGSYVVDPQKYFGSVLPKFTGGIQNSFKILKSIIVNANFDFQIGGKFCSVSENMGDYSGLSARTSGNNDKGNPIRDPVDEGGGVHVRGVDATTSQDVDYYVDAFDYFAGMPVWDSYIYDLTYLKFREFSLGYSIPAERLQEFAKQVKGITISFVCLNPWLIYSDSKGFDPTEVSNPGGEIAQYPGTRSFGINLKINM